MGGTRRCSTSASSSPTAPDTRWVCWPWWRWRCWRWWCSEAGGVGLHCADGLVGCVVWPVRQRETGEVRQLPHLFAPPFICPIYLPHLSCAPSIACRRGLQDPAVTRRVLDYMLFMNSKVLFKHLRHDAGQYQSHIPVSVHVNYHPGGGGWARWAQWAQWGAVAGAQREPCWLAEPAGLGHGTQPPTLRGALPGLPCATCREV